MTNVIDFPGSLPMEFIDEEHMAKHGDAALLLRCFEIVKDTLEVINEPEYSIEKEDDTHIDLIRAFYALKVLFRRKTGHDADDVAREHWEAMSRHLLEGAPLPEQRIPIVTMPGNPHPPSAFDAMTDLQLATASLSYARRVSESIMTHSPHALDMAEARLLSIDATTAMRVLKQRLAGNSPSDASSAVKRTTARGETLQ
ncbi:hypothetical protein [Pseudomonas syringae group genomosp. 3]|uniref:hypothetical protein n=1 Tax=Pseudomonas syringae group genomosp. 3 TaxID=251701 RepID=UPI0006B8908B|nr:hypothetical protein [Pseudomonas syringae group genomosp. 3]KPC13022.1 Uncharacterized protein AC503_4123 [Pseudomonas syringae pv. maculicola]